MIKFNRITFDPKIMGGQACIRGMRIPISLIVNLVANGMEYSEIIEEYPDLEPEDITQALQYAAWLAQEKIYLPSCHFALCVKKARAVEVPFLLSIYPFQVSLTSYRSLLDEQGASAAANDSFDSI